MKRIIVLSIFALLIAISAFAQGKDKQAQEKRDYSRIMVTYRNYGDSVVVRWAPNNPAIWSICNRYGYKVERVYEDVIGKDEDGFDITQERVVPVRSEIFKPLSQEKMIERYKDEKHPQGMVATQFLYGEVDLTQGANMDGAISQIIAQDEAQRMRFAYTLLAADLDPDVADAVGLRYSFKTKGLADTVFTIRITPLVDSSIAKLAPVTVSIEKGYINTLKHSPRNLWTEKGDKNVKLYWARGDNFSAYYIERSIDSINFVPLNKSPFFTSTATEEDIKEQNFFDDISEADSLMRPAIPMPIDKYSVYLDTLANNVKYYYRVYGIDAFGDKSPYSEIVAGMGEAKLSQQPPDSIKAEILAGGKIRISWREPANKSKLQGYLIMHSHTFGEENPTLITQDLLLPGTTQFIHENISEGTYNIYHVFGIDNEGKYLRTNSVTAYISDTIAPQPPKGLKVTIDSIGNCLITWDHSPEPDVTGYKVYYANIKNQYFNQLTSVPTEVNAFIDKINLNLLNKEIYYRVLAVDRAGNHSELSEICTAMIPDIHPPITPVVKSFFAGADYINIKFIIGPDVDMKEHYVIKRRENAEWQTIKTILQQDVKNQIIDFSDKDLKEEGYFEYALQSEDLSGLRSEISQIIPITIKPAIPEILPIKIEGKYNAKEQLVSLKWKKPETKQKFHYVLYKKVGNEPWDIYKSYGSEISECSDSRIEPGKKYGYKILPYGQGIAIGTGEEVIISVP